MLSKVRVLALALPVCLLALPMGCKPKAGAKCGKEGREVCQDKGSALVCHDGKWEVMACRGAVGCVPSGDSAQCDNMNAEENDRCNLDGDFACTMDKRSFLQCSKKKWTPVGACRGPKGCAVDTKHVKCDSTVAKLDDACLKDDEGDHACAEDKKTALVCRAGKFILAGKCGGARGCKVKDDGIDCDDSVGEVGDPCDLADHYACAKDGRVLIKCVGNRFVKDEECKKGKTCKIVGDKVQCG